MSKTRLKIDEVPAKWEERTEVKVILNYLNGLDSI